MTEPRLPADQRRASHADREAVVERLREAAGDGRLSLDELETRIEAAYAARTYAELDPITRDLPHEHERAVRHPPVPVAAVPARVTGRPGRRWSLALMGGTDRKGRWRLGGSHGAIAVMGGVGLDLREAELETPVVTIRAFALMGGVEVVVPDDCVLDASGVGLMGSFEESDTGTAAPPGAPVVRVRGLAVVGSVEVVRRSRRVRLEHGDETGELER